MDRDIVDADVVVVGYGLAGATAAITAHDAGDEVIMLEKSAYFGGNSILAGGGILCVDDPEKAFQYFNVLCGGRTDPEVIHAQVDMMLKNEDYLRSLCNVNGAKLVKRGIPGTYAFPGREGVNNLGIDEVPDFQGYPWLMPSEKGYGGGARLMKVMEDNVNLREIPVMYATTAKELMTHRSGVVSGVVAEREGKEIIFQSRKAVILASGGFEHNENLKLQFLEAKPYYSMSPLTHTGDGIIMSMKLGAALWHMWHVHGGYGFKYPEFPVAFRHHLHGGRDPYLGRPYYIKMRWIVVDRKGRRFMNEYPPAPQDTPHRNLSFFDPDLPGYPRIPCYLIFDEPARKERHIARPLGLKEIGYRWSEDNSKEIEKGWIIKGESLEELARRIKVPADNLKDTLKTWNSYVKSGKDLDFGRLPETMFGPIEVPPYYAMEAWPIIVNTQGGPWHNAKQQVVDVTGSAIPHLYAVGELGSMYGHIYELGGNLGECISSGIIAGQQASEEKSLPR